VPWICRTDVGRAAEQSDSTGPDPVDARAQIIELTPRGRQALRVMRSNALNVEKRWEKALGPERLDELRETLVLLLQAESGDSDA
jgi:DNA-binding MarR family transcriptional regulator